MKTKILLTRAMFKNDIEYIKKELDKIIKDQYELIVPTDFDENTLLSNVKNVDILLGPYISKKIIKNANKLKMIQVPWTGMDVVNFNALKGSQIVLCNSHSNSRAVAELGIGLTLDLLKKISFHDTKLKQGNWNRDNTPLTLQSRMLSQENIIILGCGHIGLQLAKYCKAFGTHVVGFYEKDDITIDGIKVLNMTKLDNYLKNASIIISSLPLTSETKEIINMSMIKKLNNNCLIINVSRSEIVNEDDIYLALKNRLIGGFASDVWWNTPKRGETIGFVSTKYNFEIFPNVIMSPHRAGYVEGCLPHLDDAIINIANFIKKKPLINIKYRGLA